LGLNNVIIQGRREQKGPVRRRFSVRGGSHFGCSALALILQFINII
jgi:hypothetical protein